MIREYLISHLFWRCWKFHVSFLLNKFPSNFFFAVHTLIQPVMLNVPFDLMPLEVGNHKKIVFLCVCERWMNLVGVVGIELLRYLNDIIKPQTKNTIRYNRAQAPEQKKTSVYISMWLLNYLLGFCFIECDCGVATEK